MSRRPTVNIKSPEKRARLGERIKIAATSSGISLKDLAFSIGVAPALIYQYVRGITNIPLETLSLVAEATGTPVEFFDPDKDTRTAMQFSAEPASKGEELVAKDRIALEIRQLYRLAEAYDTSRNVAALKETYNQILSLARIAADRKQEAYVLWQLGKIRFSEQDYAGASDLLTTAHDIFRELQLEDYRIYTTLDLGLTAAEMGNYEQAVAFSQESASSANPDHAWHGYLNAADIELRRRNAAEAYTNIVQSARILENIHDENVIAQAIPHLAMAVGELAFISGHFSAAGELWSRNLSLAAETRQAVPFMESLLHLAELNQMSGKLSEARQLLDQAVVLSAFLFEDANRLAVMKAHLASVLVGLGQAELARDHARTALRIANRLGGPRGIVLANISLSGVLCALGSTQDALAYADDALAEAQRIHRPALVARARDNRAKLLLRDYLNSRTARSLREAEAESLRAVDASDKAGAFGERLSSRVTLANVYRLGGQNDVALATLNTVDSLRSAAAVPLEAIATDSKLKLPTLLHDGAVDIVSAFESNGVSMPEFEWRLESARAALTTGKAAFAAQKRAATALNVMLAGLSATDAQAYVSGNADVSDAILAIGNSGTTKADKEEARGIADRLARGTAVVGAITA